MSGKQIACLNGITGNEVKETVRWEDLGFYPETETTESGFSQTTSLCFQRGGRLSTVNKFEFFGRPGSGFLWQVTSVNWDKETVTLRRSNIETTWVLGVRK